MLVLYGACLRKGVWIVLAMITQVRGLKTLGLNPLETNYFS